MSGYIALTNVDWLDTITRNKELSEVVFWCRKTSFRAIFSGEPFYFLGKGKFSTNMERYLLGQALFVRFEKIMKSKAWDKYGVSLGFDTESSFVETIEKMYHYPDFELGCIILRNPILYETKVPLGACKVGFSQYIVSGKTISNDECNQINSVIQRLQS